MKSITSHLRSWSTDVQAVAAVEFSIVAPFMLVLMVGGVELGNGMAIKVKVTATAHSIADLTSQQQSINNAQMSNFLDSAAKIFTPYPFTTATGMVTVSEVSTDASGAATVTWSDSRYGTARTKGQPITLPTSLAGTPNVSFILGEASYRYQPNLGYNIVGTVTLTDSYFLYPRKSVSITRTAS
ncbi:MAG: pilus assembly protein [Bradyrhizobium sp.]|uniref:TadE/TadG family type IV pilus assembly protein n=1 Tax=Bradyrhizobium sp. TaxID=376 RepID=UPI001D7928C4|nr:TadE/TadG family type IV pilus assembly protein [Bradyrhizobium sp.]MBV9561392.1 pilus assembly protein [Bradyrhizobium sp.]